MALYFLGFRFVRGVWDKSVTFLREDVYCLERAGKPLE